MQIQGGVWKNSKVLIIKPSSAAQVHIKNFPKLPIVSASGYVYTRAIFYLTIGSWLACVYRVMDARGKFGEHERSVRVARGAADCNSSFTSALLKGVVCPSPAQRRYSGRLHIILERNIYQLLTRSSYFRSFVTIFLFYSQSHFSKLNLLLNSSFTIISYISFHTLQSKTAFTLLHVGKPIR